MYSLKNSVRLLGNLGMDPELKQTESGKKLVRFSLATNESYRNASGDKITETQWFNLIAWGRVAELAGKYLKKGSEVCIEGKLINRNYTDKEGVRRYATEIQVGEILFLGGSKSASTVENTNPLEVLDKGVSLEDQEIPLPDEKEEVDV